MVFYCYSTTVAFVFQKVVLPLFPGLHGGSGLLGADSIFFHNAAVKLAESIRVHGWGQWTATPGQGLTGNVSVLALFYVFFGYDPTVVIPLNTAVHATSGLFVFLIARTLWPGRVGIYSGIIGACLFIGFPSALNWYAQVHKDGFAILGMLMMFYSWLQLTRDSSRLRKGLWIFFGNLSGLSLIIFVRPYNLMVLMVSAIILSFVSFLYYMVTKRMRKSVYLMLVLAAFVVAVGTVNLFVPEYWAIEKKAMLLAHARGEGIHWEWKRSRVVPEVIDRVIEKSAAVRVINIYYSRAVKAKSLIDEDVMPDSVWTSLAYVPRAALMAVFGPFPDTWFRNSGPARLVSVGETLIWYLLVPGVLLTFWYRRSLPIFLLALNALVFLAVLGFTNPNMGTLYRFRYVHLSVLMLMGVMGWMELLRRRWGERIKGFNSRPDPDVAEADTGGRTHDAISSQSRSTVASAGFTVIGFTLLCNILFVARDIILARWFGLGNDLDVFFIAMIVPMFLVNVLSIPVGTVMVPQLISAFRGGSREEAQGLITSSSTAILCCMAALCFLLLVTSRFYIPILGWGFTAEKVSQAQRMLVIVLPLLFFSGFVILGNAVLNARQRFALPAIAQAVVPLIAILGLFAAAKEIGIFAIAAGMVIGQAMNLVIVGYYVGKEGLSVIPGVRFADVRKLFHGRSRQLKGLTSQYVPLVFSSLFVALAIPVNSAIASSLAAGSVAAFNLGTKFIVFFTGLIGTGISTVILPYFSAYFARNRIMDVRRELSFFLLLATIIPIPLTIVLFLLTSRAVGFVFRGEGFSIEDTGMLTRVIEYGIIQLPFFCTNMLFAKFANAKRKNALILVSSSLGLALNIALSLLFIRKMGVGGIALASSLSVMFATALFIFAGHRYNDVSWVDVMFITVAWLLFLTILLCFHFRNIAGVIIASTPLLFTIGYHILTFFDLRIFGKRDAPG